MGTCSACPARRGDAGGEEGGRAARKPSRGENGSTSRAEEMEMWSGSKAMTVEGTDGEREVEKELWLDARAVCALSESCRVAVGRLSIRMLGAPKSMKEESTSWSSSGFALEPVVGTSRVGVLGAAEDGTEEMGETSEPRRGTLVSMARKLGIVKKSAEPGPNLGDMWMS
jgi:hypothetical protein